MNERYCGIRSRRPPLFLFEITMNKHDDEEDEGYQSHLLEQEILKRTKEFLASELKKVPKEWLEDMTERMLDDFHWLLWGARDIVLKEQSQK